MNSKELGVKIQMAREGQNMSQEELALAIGCSQSALSNYEKGKRHIYLGQLEKLSVTLDKPLHYFVENTSIDNQKATGKEFDEQHDKPKKESNSERNKQFIELMNDIYALSNKNINELSNYVDYLKWKQNKGE